MKKLVTVLVLILTFMLLCSCTTQTEEVGEINIASFFEFPKSTENDVKYRVTDAGEVEIVSYEDSTTHPEIEIPDEIDGKPVVKICDFSLFNTDSLRKITIGKNVREIGSWALTNNKSMKEFAVSPENEYFTAVDGVLFSKDKKTLVCYPTAKNVNIDKYGQTSDTTTYVVPEGTETIADRAFYRCGYLTDVTIPASVKKIGEMSFHRCEIMTDFVFPEGVETIGKDAFTYCMGLTELNFPSTLKSIDTYAFSFCENVKSVSFQCKEGEVTLADKWEPTRDGQKIKDLKISWK